MTDVLRIRLSEENQRIVQSLCDQLAEALRASVASSNDGLRTDLSALVADGRAFVAKMCSASPKADDFARLLAMLQTIQSQNSAIISTLGALSARLATAEARLPSAESSGLPLVLRENPISAPEQSSRGDAEISPPVVEGDAP